MHLFEAPSVVETEEEFGRTTTKSPMGAIREKIRQVQEIRGQNLLSENASHLRYHGHHRRNRDEVSFTNNQVNCLLIRISVAAGGAKVEVEYEEDIEPARKETIPSW